MAARGVDGGQRSLAAARRSRLHLRANRDERGHGMLPILYFIDQYLIDLFIWIIIGSAILSWLIAFNVVNPYNQFVRSLWDLFNRITEPFLRPIRRMLPDMGGIDISPVVLILILVFIRVVIIRGWLMPLFS
jgi:YggT family protein